MFICIVRNIFDWINSFYKVKHHLPIKFKKGLSEEQLIDEFLNKEFWSFDNSDGKCDISNEMMTDRNIYTGKRYKNIFELRHTKIKYMLEDLPNKVNNHIFIRYEDLLDDFNNTMIKLKDKGLNVNYGINFPINTNIYRNGKFLSDSITFFVRNKEKNIPDKMIINNPNLIKCYEKKLGYI